LGSSQTERDSIVAFMHEPTLDTTIEGWLRRWERLLGNNPQETLSAAVRTEDALADILSRIRGAKAKKKTLADRLALSRRLAMHDTGWRALVRSRGGRPEDVDSELAKTPPDLAALELVLSQSVYAAATASEIRDALRAELTKERPDPSTIEALSSMFASLCLRHRTAPELISAPHKGLAEAVWMRALESAGSSDPLLPGEALILELIQRLVRPIASQVTDDVESPPGLEQAMAAFVSDEHINPISAVALGLVHGRILVTSASDLQGARKIARSYAHHVLVNVLYRRFARLPGTSNPDSSSKLLGLMQKSGIDFGTESIPAILDAALEAAALEAAVWVAAEFASTAVETDICPDVASQVAQVVFDHGQRAGGYAQRSLHGTLRDLLQPTVAIAVTALQCAGPGSLDGGLFAVFRRSWAMSIARGATSVSDLVHRLPHQTPLDDRAALVDACLAPLVGRPQVRYVTWSVVGIRPNVELWRLGSVEFFDPHRVNFGAARTSSHGDKPVTCVRVRVEAESDEEAKVRAWPSLERALDVLVFAFSVQQTLGGFRPEVLRDSSVEAPEEGIRWSRGATHRAEVGEAIDGSDAAIIAAAYEPLIQRAAVPSQLSVLETRVIRALGWYRRARWQLDPTRRVLDYWIVLEQFFAAPSEPNKERAAARAAALCITWRDVPALEQVRSLAQKARSWTSRDSVMRSPVDAVPDLKDWDRHDSVLMNLSRAEAFVAALGQAGQKPVYELFLRDLRDAWSQKSAIICALRDRQWACRLQLERVYQYRCGIVHEAESPGLEVAALSDSLERIAEDCLKKAVHYLFEVQDAVHTVDALTKWWSRPWDDAAW
jgi:hypothetical protein